MKTILSFFILLSGMVCSAQGYFTVYSPTLVPQNPTTADQISIIVKIMSPSGSGKLSKTSSVNLAQSEIDLSSCIQVYATTVITYQTDTFNIGQLPAGVYTINYTATPSNTGSCVPSSNSSTMNATFTVTSVTAIKEQALHSSISFFPNPFLDKLTVKGVEKATLTNIIVLNLLGKPVAAFDRLTEGDEINLEKFPQGVYWLKYEYGDKSKTVKLIKGNP